jgi:hypothetical protein
VQVVAPRPLSHWGVSLASWALLALCCVASLIPGLGFGVWVVAGPVLLITFVLGIIAISRGGTLQGVLILLASLIVVPVFVFVAPIVTDRSGIRRALACASRVLQLCYTGALFARAAMLLAVQPHSFCLCGSAGVRRYAPLRCKTP